MKENVRLYIRLPHEQDTEKLDFLVLWLAPDFCLSETKALIQALKPEYASLRFFGSEIFYWRNL